MPDWTGRRVAVLASGPSLSQADAIAVRDAGFITVAVNTTWKLAPWCDVIYAGDSRWWKAYGHEVNIPAKRFCRTSSAFKTHRARCHKTKLKHDYNSGELAIELAAQRKPELIVLLGFDASVKHGVHWHGPHEDTPNPTAGRARRWLRQFDRIPEAYPDANIVNCSRYTEINCFPRESLESVLARVSQSASRCA